MHGATIKNSKLSVLHFDFPTINYYVYVSGNSVHNHYIDQLPIIKCHGKIASWIKTFANQWHSHLYKYVKHCL